MYMFDHESKRIEVADTLVRNTKRVAAATFASSIILITLRAHMRFTGTEPTPSGYGGWSYLDLSEYNTETTVIKRPIEQSSEAQIL